MNTFLSSRFAQTTGSTPEANAYVSAMATGLLTVILVIVVITIIAMWVMYKKAGKPGWTALIPFYNLYVLLQIVGRPWWWLLLIFVPVVNIVISVILAVDTAKVFDKSVLFAVLGLIVFSPIGYLIIAFDKSEYKGPIAGSDKPSRNSPTAAAQ